MSKLREASRAYTYDDFIIAPSRSEVRSRKLPSLSTEIGDFKYEVPIVSAPMNTVTEIEMLRAMHSVGAVGVLHRYLTIEDQVAQVQKLLAGRVVNDFFVAVGANGDAMERVAALADIGFGRFCVDVANGHSVHCIEAVRRIKDRYPRAYVMAGNVCTYEGAYDLAEAGAEAIRVGVGPGSMCTTRLVTGHGMPQLTAIEECAKIKWEGNGFSDNSLVESKFSNVTIIADGGIRGSGDIIKALAIGADAVMVGGLLAATKETPGQIIEKVENGERVLYKQYAGMASEEGRDKWFDRSKTGFVPEGTWTERRYNGKLASKVVEGLADAVKVGMSYSGALTVAELRERAQWRRVTGAGYHEGTPHGK